MMGIEMKQSVIAGEINNIDGSAKRPTPIGFIQVSYQGIMDPSKTARLNEEPCKPSLIL